LDMPNTQPKALCILGATGSIGDSVRDIVLSAPDQFSVSAVTAHSNVKSLAEYAVAVKAKSAVIARDDLYDDLKSALDGTQITVMAGQSALCEAAADQDVDLVVAGIVGIAGLAPVMAAIQQGKDIAIANKEVLVAAGPQVLAAAAKSGSKLLPTDSEHNAIFQVFEKGNRDQIERLILTASGGPFRTWPKDAIDTATPEQACNHPNWSMGAKISVDSATMMNKGLEVIEAHYLFNMPHDKIDVIVHPQSVVHSMVEYADGSVLAQMGASDMRTPICSALAWPRRMKTPGKVLNSKTLSRLDFEEPDSIKFPAISLAYDALKSGQAACIVLNAVNEVAVAAFLKGTISFANITQLCRKALDELDGGVINTLEDVFELDQTTRQNLNIK
jgi:1-deoxy-D-xylulose-5-phosphate reductoisomerase